MLGKQRVAMGGNGFGNFRPGNHYWDTLGKQREAGDLVIFRLGIATGASLGSKLAKQREAMDFVSFGLGITTGIAWEATRRNGFGNFRAGNHY